MMGGGGGWCAESFPCQTQLRLCSVELWLSWGFDKKTEIESFFFSNFRTVLRFRVEFKFTVYFVHFNVHVFYQSNRKSGNMTI